MVLPMWTFGLALGVGIVILAYETYSQYNRRQHQSSYHNERPRNNSPSNYNSWQPTESSNSEESCVRHRGARNMVEPSTATSQSLESSERNENEHNATEGNGAVVEETKICAICNRPLIYNRRILDCEHIFHRSCVIQWRRINDACPVCSVPFC